MLMRALKNYWLRAILFSILGLGISFGANASTDNKNPKTVKKEIKEAKVQTTQWFVYSASSHPTNLTDASNPNNYTLVTNPSELCAGSNNLCAIRAQVDMSNPAVPKPIITGQPIQTELNNYFDPLAPGYDEDQIVQKD